MNETDPAQTDDQTRIVSLASRGGKARAAALTPEARTEIAQQAAEARWRVPDRNPNEIVRAAHDGVLSFPEFDLQCAVLDDSGHTRVLSERGVTGSLGGKRGGSHWRRRREASNETLYLPVYLSARNLLPFIPASLARALSQPIKYRTKSGAVAYGVEASLLPEICDVLLKAREAGKLTDPQKPLAARAYTLMHAFAQVGIVALVDEATGYQEERERDELSRILAAYITKDLLPWAKRFPDAFYEHMFRLRGWSYRPVSVKRPRMVGKLTSELVYEKLPPGVIDELRRRNPVIGGRRRLHHHRLLTDDIGQPHLERHLAAVTTLMKVAPTWDSFRRMFDKAFPPPGGSQTAMFEDDGHDDSK